MNTDKKQNLPDSLAKVVSIVFHPLLMPVYGLAIIFSAPTLFGYLPFEVKKLLFMIVLINNVFLPLSLIPFYFYRKIISTWTIDNREERRIPLLITTVLYITTSFIILRFPIPSFIKSFLFAAVFLSAVVTGISFWWKISLHSVGAGALIGIVFLLSYRMYTPLVDYLVAVIITGGLVLSSRLRLNIHSPLQVWLGFLTGFLGLIIFMMFIH